MVEVLHLYPRDARSVIVLLSFGRWTDKFVGIAKRKTSNFKRGIGGKAYALALEARFYRFESYIPYQLLLYPRRCSMTDNTTLSYLQKEKLLQEFKSKLLKK